MSVIHLARAPEPAPEPEPAPTGHVLLQPAARHAMTALRARVSELERIFSASSTPATQHARIAALTDAAIGELQRVRRFSR